MTQTLVIIPTYNEAENIARLIEAVLGVSADLKILIVDDASPDRTAEMILDRFGAEHPRVKLIRRPAKLGLGTAYSAGFRHAIERGYECAITMDADFSHNPDDIPRLLNASSGTDLVIGSRYVAEGKTINWGIFRKMISRCANFVANNFLSLQPHDCTSGFRLYRSEILQRVEFASIHADGYSYLVEILFRACRIGARVQEVPIHFIDRQRGKSKISRKEIAKAMMTVVRLRFLKQVYAESRRMKHPIQE